MYLAKNTFTVNGKSFKRWGRYSKEEIPEGWEGYFQPVEGYKPEERKEKAVKSKRSKRKK